MILTDELCEKLAAAANKKSKELGIDVSFAICDENGLLKLFRRFGEALVLSITLVPGKAYTSAITQSKTKDVALWAKEGNSLMAIQSNDPKITLVAGGIGVGGGTKAQDCEIAEYVLKEFEKFNSD